jgi:hypothetical protein
MRTALPHYQKTVIASSGVEILSKQMPVPNFRFCQSATTNNRWSVITSLDELFENGLEIKLKEGETCSMYRFTRWMEETRRRSPFVIWMKQDGTLLISTPNWVSDGNERRSIQLPPGRRPKGQRQGPLHYQNDNYINENQDDEADPGTRWTAAAFPADDTGYQPWETGIDDDDTYHN